MSTRKLNFNKFIPTSKLKFCPKDQQSVEIAKKSYYQIRYTSTESLSAQKKKTSQTPLFVIYGLLFLFLLNIVTCCHVYSFSDPFEFCGMDGQKWPSCIVSVVHDSYVRNYFRKEFVRHHRNKILGLCLNDLTNVFKV